ncbi:class I SAM-dependent methyltransferase [Rummeliibacillus sp. NPDC094406]|uniref:class I SAM-dependent methyltransferase n=1 Tax=Rummeliibacillus sp. NPDC094406 TaxID=3364511 RepID=UPI0038083A71
MDHTGKVVSHKDGHDIIACEKCGFYHVYPFPSQEQTENLYSEEYYQKNRKDYIKNLEEDKEWWQNLYSERIQQISTYLNNDEDINVLDIGTGAGYFLTAAKEAGWEELGIEPSTMASYYGKENGLNIIPNFFDENISNKIGKFDVIHMNHVLEHMLNPTKILRMIHNNLENEGVFCLAVPNDFNELQQIACTLNENKEWWITPFEHINYFSFDSLKKLLESNGFKVLEETTSFPMELFVLMGENYIKESTLGRQCHKKRKKLEKNLFTNNPNLKQKLYKSLAKEGLGRDVILIARKRGSLDD